MNVCVSASLFADIQAAAAAPPGRTHFADEAEEPLGDAPEWVQALFDGR
jgi:hypothetical protein